MTGPDDRWLAGGAYERYMGRWSRPLARAFVAWLGAPASARWLDVGCGTGALTAAICEGAEPHAVVGCDPSPAFVEHAQAHSSDARASFVVGSATALPEAAASFDAVVSGLVLNFVPDDVAAVAAMRERAEPDGIVAAYVWDYAQGMQFLRYFWDEAAALDARASVLDEGRRFALCRSGALGALLQATGLRDVATSELEISTDFESFEDYWTPFLSGTGPAPAYVASLDIGERQRLRERLRERLVPEADGSIRLRARAWAARATR